MPSIRNQDLNITINPETNMVTATLSYVVRFTALDRNLAHLGMSFRVKAYIMGVDAPSWTGPSVIYSFPSTNFPPMPVGGAFPFNTFIDTPVQTHTVTKPRADFQEDPVAGDADEIRGKISIEIVNALPAVSDNYTNIITLPG